MPQIIYMPEKLEKCVSDVKGEGKSDDSSWAICTDSIKEENILKQIFETKLQEATSIGGREVKSWITINGANVPVFTDETNKEAGERFLEDKDKTPKQKQQSDKERRQNTKLDESTEKTVRNMINRDISLGENQLVYDIQDTLRHPKEMSRDDFEFKIRRLVKDEKQKKSSNPNKLKENILKQIFETKLNEKVGCKCQNQ